VGEDERVPFPQVEGRARHHELAHHGRRHQVLDRLFVEARRQLARQVEEVAELENLHRELVVDLAQLVVDEAVLDRRGRAGGHAAQEAVLLGAVGAAARAGAQDDERDRLLALHDRAEDLDP
jgi:hypothetical protein